MNYLQELKSYLTLPEATLRFEVTDKVAEDLSEFRSELQKSNNTFIIEFISGDIKQDTKGDRVITVYEGDVVIGYQNTEGSFVNINGEKKPLEYSKPLQGAIGFVYDEKLNKVVGIFDTITGLKFGAKEKVNYKGFYEPGEILVEAALFGIFGGLGDIVGDIFS